VLRSGLVPPELWQDTQLRAMTACAESVYPTEPARAKAEVQLAAAPVPPWFCVPPVIVRAVVVSLPEDERPPPQAEASIKSGIMARKLFLKSTRPTLKLSSKEHDCQV